MRSKLKQYLGFVRAMRAWREIDAFYWARTTEPMRRELVVSGHDCSVITFVLAGAAVVVFSILICMGLWVVSTGVGVDESNVNAGSVAWIGGLLGGLSTVAYLGGRFLLRSVDRWSKEALSMLGDMVIMPMNEDSLLEMQDSLRRGEAELYLRCVVSNGCHPRRVDLRVVRHLSGLDANIGESLEAFKKDAMGVISKARYGQAKTSKS